VLASSTTMQWDPQAKGWNAGAVIADASLNRRQTTQIDQGVEERLVPGHQRN